MMRSAPHDERNHAEARGWSAWSQRCAERFPRTDVCVVEPTPLEPHAALACRFGLRDLTIKRDDKTHPVVGGNKTRKLAFILGDAIARGARTLVTVGGVGSNHALATSWFAARASMETVALLLKQPDHPSLGVYRQAHDTLGTTVLGSQCRWSDVLKVARRLPKAYLIGPGGSSPLGIMGAFLGGLELAEQLQGLACSGVVVAAGSGGTAVGLALGLGAAECRVPVYAIATVPRPLLTERRLVAMLRRQTRFIGRHLGRLPRPAPLHLVAGFVGRGYGSATRDGARVASSVASTGGPRLDHVYTAKAFAGLVHLAKGPLRHRHAVFVHTKGAWNTLGFSDSSA